MRLVDFSVLTFDCYGTLIDWESGIVQALQPWLEAAGVRASREQILAAFAEVEAPQQAATPGLLYPELLAPGPWRARGAVRGRARSGGGAVVRRLDQGLACVSRFRRGARLSEAALSAGDPLERRPGLVR